MRFSRHTAVTET